jgi:hypothetical protein
MFVDECSNHALAIMLGTFYSGSDFHGWALRRIIQRALKKPLQQGGFEDPDRKSLLSPLSMSTLSLLSLGSAELGPNTRLSR